MSEPLNDLEREVLDRMLSRDGPGYAELRAQLEMCSIAGREMTGVGFFTALVVGSDAPLVDHELIGNPVGTRHNHSETVFAEIEGLKWGAIFELWLEGGRLAQLEGNSFAGDNPWPDSLDTFEVRWEPVNRGA